MPINFDALPNNKPQNSEYKLAPVGFGIYTIEKCKNGVSKAGNPMLDFQLKHADGSVVFDRLIDMDNPSVLYKIGRMVSALRLPLRGSLDLKDLGVLIEGKQVVADIKHIQDDYKMEKLGVTEPIMKAEVDIFANDIYYPVSEYQSLTADADTATTPETAPNTTGTY